MSSRQEQKAAARAAREEAQAREATDAQRRRRIMQLVGVLVLAAVVVAVVVALSGGGGGTKTTKKGEPAPVGEAYQLLGGIPESKGVLGKPDAPLTLVEFNDLQCPVCKEYTSAVFPTLVKRYVRTGKMRMEFRLQQFIGPDSEKAARAAAAAYRQNRAWMFQDIFYSNQQQENSGYVTDDFLRSIALATPGLDVDRFFTDLRSPSAGQMAKTGSAEFAAKGFTGTPSFLVGKTGGPLSPLRWTALTPDQFTGPIDSLLAK
jgi:protein-disulfide isomerase